MLGGILRLRTCECVILSHDLPTALRKEEVRWYWSWLCVSLHSR